MSFASATTRATRRAESAELRVAFVGSYVPRRCGIATFTADTVTAVRSADPATDALVFAIDEPGSRRAYDAVVAGRIAQGERASYRAAAAALNDTRADVVNIQHEFGLYGNHHDGGFEDLLGPLLDELRRPVITTLHTVLPQPEPWRREVVRAIVDRSTETVVMVDAAATLLRTAYGIAKPVRVIPHGAPDVAAMPRGRGRAELGVAGRIVLSTFGLLDPRKGLEYAIAAMTDVVARHPNAIYVVIGQTHPELVRHEGERYRESLRGLASRLGLDGHVRFVDEYVPLRDIVDYLRATDVYLTPYIDANQITSGTLAYAMGAGRPIVSTPYLHAREALADGRGVLVPFRSASEIADAVNDMIEDPVRRERLGRSAAAFTAGAAWPLVGARLLALMRDIAERSARATRAA